MWKRYFFTIKEKVVTLFSPRTMMTHREKTDTDFFLIREEWIVPENLVHVRRTRQSDPHTNRTRRISDTRVNYIKEPWCLVKKVSLASIFISETHEARGVFTSRKKEIEPSKIFPFSGRRDYQHSYIFRRAGSKKQARSHHGSSSASTSRGIATW